MGRKKLPTAIKEAKGTIRKSRMNPLEPKPFAILELPEPPHQLNATALKIWEDLGASLIEKRLLSSLDLNAFNMLVLNLGLYEECIKHLLSEGLIIKAKTNQGEVDKINPYLNVKRHLEDKLIKLFAEFGLTPSSRSNVSEIKAFKTDGAKDIIERLKLGS